MICHRYIYAPWKTGEKISPIILSPKFQKNPITKIKAGLLA